MAHNPAWPLMDYAICWQGARGASPVQPYWCSVTGRTEGKVSITRGKTYELDQVQPGEATVTLRNDDGVFDPSNAASPYAGFVTPYRLMRIRAQYPPTANLLTADQATAFYDSEGTGGAGSTLPTGVLAGNYPLTITAGSSPSNAYSVAVPANAVAGDLLGFYGWSVTPGSPHAGQAMVAGAGLTGYARLYWLNAAGTIIGSVTGTPVALTGTPQLLTVAGVAPANAAGASLTIGMTNSPTSASTATIASIQVEQNTSPSTWAQPGVWYSMFTGYVERWPQSWSSGGNYGVVDLTIVDLFAYWSSLPLRDPFIADVLALNPNFYYPLNEAEGAAVFQDATGNRPPAMLTIQNSPWIKAGQSVSSDDNSAPGGYAFDLTGAFLGSAGPVVATEQIPAGQVPGYAGLAFPANGGAISIPPNPATGSLGPPLSGTWCRVIAARATSGTSALSGLYPWAFQSTANYPGYANQYLLNLFNNSTGNGGVMQFIGSNADSTTATFLEANMPGMPQQASSTSPYPVTDGDWHLYLFGVDASGNAWLGVNGRLASHAGAVGPTNYQRGNATYWQDTLGLYTTTIEPTQAVSWVGQIAHAFELPFIPTLAQWQALTQSWRNGWNGDTATQRYQRILGWTGSNIPASLDQSNLTSYGPVVDIAGGANPTNVLAALQAVVSSEIGQHFVTAAGTLAFQARSRRYNTTPLATFGENTAAGETPYVGAQTDYDPTRVANDVQTSTTYGNTPYTAQDPVSEANYGQVGLQQTINTLTPETMLDGAGYLLYTNSVPTQRLEALPVDVGANPAAWPIMLARELGDTVQVNRRPSNAPMLSITGFVEQIVWDLTEAAAATCTVQVTNQARHLFGQCDSPTYGLCDSTAILAY